MAVGAITDTLTVYGGLTALDPKLEDTGNPATDGKQYVGMPKLRSNVLLEYRGAGCTRLRVHLRLAVCRAPAGQRRQYAVLSELQHFRRGCALCSAHWGKLTTWRLAVNNVTDKAYWSTIGPSNITGTGLGNMTAHLGAPRTMLGSVTVAF